MYKVGDRISRSIEKWQCGKCGHSVKTLEKTEYGWRCIRCVGLTEDNWVSSEPIIPTALDLYREIMTPVQMEVIMVEIRRGCDNCGKEYDVNEFLPNGRPAHPHHCNDCCKKCIQCGEWRPIAYFLPNKDSNAYKDYIATVARAGESPLGLLTGRDAKIDKCSHCQRFQEEPKEEKPRRTVKVEVPKIDFASHLEMILAGKT